MARNNGTMDWEDTICHKVTTCIKEMERAVRKGEFDPELVTQTLVSIRADAIKMENALKANKVLRLKHNIDPEYREMMKEKMQPGEVNEFGKIDAVTPERPEFELTLKDQNGHVVYKNKLFAFIMCAVERIEDMDAAGIMDGTVQTLAVGHDLAVWYAYDQLKQKFAAKFTQIMLKMAASKRSGFFQNREMRRKALRAANGLKVK